MSHHYYELLCSRCHNAIKNVNDIHKDTRGKLCLAKKKAQGAYVYLMHDLDQDLLKIGFTENPARRFKEIFNSNNNRIEFVGIIPGTRTNEAILHRKFKEYKRKLEWFTYSLDIVDYFLSHPEFKKALD